MDKPGKSHTPGNNVSFKTRKTEHPEVMRWINMQDNFTDSIRYLIEKEIETNGVRNLQRVIPISRDFNPRSGPERQTAAQFVAQAYDYAGTSLTADPHPFPQEVNEAPNLKRVYPKTIPADRVKVETPSDPDEPTQEELDRWS